MANDTNRLSFTRDANSLLKDSYVVAASAAAQVNGANYLLDVGDGVYHGWLIINVTTIETDSSNELYTITVQGLSRGTGATRDLPNTASSTIQNLASIALGHSSVRPGGAATSTTGVYLLPFRNVVLDTTYPVLRVYTTVAGTVATGITYDADIGKMVY